MNAVGTEWVTPGLPRMMNAVGIEWVTPGLPRMMNAVGTEWVTPGLPRMMNAVGTEWVTPGLPRMGSYAIIVDLVKHPVASNLVMQYCNVFSNEQWLSSCS